MDRLDEVQALAFESDFAYAVLGNRATGTVVLVNLQGDLSEALRARAQSEGLYFCGVCGYRHGEPAIACEPSLDCKTVMVAAAREFIARLAERTGDSAEWLAKLYSLEDQRD